MFDTFLLFVRAVTGSFRHNVIQPTTQQEVRDVFADAGRFGTGFNQAVEDGIKRARISLALCEQNARQSQVDANLLRLLGIDYDAEGAAIRTKISFGKSLPQADAAEMVNHFLVISMFKQICGISFKGGLLSLDTQECCICEGRTSNDYGSFLISIVCWSGEVLVHDEHSRNGNRGKRKKPHHPNLIFCPGSLNAHLKDKAYLKYLKENDYTSAVASILEQLFLNAEF